MLKKQSIGINFLLILFPIVAIILSLGIGSYYIDPISIIKILIGKLFNINYNIDDLTINVLIQTRLPRILTAIIVSIALSISGAIFQSIFRNPLASPYTLGVSNGAGFGAALAIILSLSIVNVQILSILFGILSIGITFLFTLKCEKNTASLILSGMLVSSLFASLLALMKFSADPFEKLPQIIYWLMGTFNGSSYEKILHVLPFYIVVFIILWLHRWRINVISFGDVEARSYGINIEKERTFILIMAGIFTSLAVSISGIIGWIGIVIPHFARILVGPDIRKIFPVCISLGITFMLIIDDICRNASGQEIPLGVITGIIGAPLFIYFIYKKNIGWA